MMDIKLETNEEIIINSKGVLRVGCSDIYADDLILTNTNIIHIHRNNFGKIKTVERIPVSNIKIENGVPQIHMKKGTNNRWQLYISLIDSIEVFDFSLFPKKEINKWINALMLLLTNSQSHNLTEVKNEISIVEPQNELSIINKEKSNTIKDYLLSNLKKLSPKRKKILLPSLNN